MKTILFLLAFALPALLFGQAKEAKMLYYEVIEVDTLGATDTIIVEFENRYGTDLDFNDLYEYSWIVVSDSISGANAGTVALQFSNDSDTTSTPVWFTADTETIDAAPQQVFNFDGLIRSRRTRLFVTSPSGARVTALKFFGVAKRIK